MTSTTFETSVRPAPFDALAESYDETFTASRIGRAQRDVIWKEFDRVFEVGQRVLEINCGTGVDAVHLASRGVEVLACDSAPRMIEVARRRAVEAKLRAPLEFRALSIEEIGKVLGAGSPACFDGAVSNFAGLNCVEDLAAVARDLALILKPGALAVLCLFGPFCAWEIFWYLGQANVRKALRRLRSEGSLAQLGEGVTARVHYPSVRRLASTFAPEFRLKSWKGVGVAVPPSYLEPLAQKFPRVLNFAAKLDRRLGRWPLLRSMADHVLLTFERRP